LTDEELKKAHAERLPDREQMSVIKGPYPYLPVEPPNDYTIMPVPPQES
jgi:hypothetical protein